MKKWFVVLVLLGCLIVPQLVQAGGGPPPTPEEEEIPVSRYEQLEELFKKEIRYLDISFRNLYDSWVYYSFRSEVEEGEVTCIFENIAVGEYLVDVYAVDIENSMLFFGRTEIEVLPEQVTTASVILELSSSHRISQDLWVDLGNEDREVEVKIWYVTKQRPYETYWAMYRDPYIAAEKRIEMEYPIWVPLEATKVIIRLPEYHVSASWEVDWQSWEEVIFEFPTPEDSPVELAAEFLSETSDTGRIWVVPVDFGTIQEAIDAAVAGDTVKIKGGIHYGSLVLKPGVNIEGTGWRPKIEGWGTIISGKMGEGALQTKLKDLTIVSSGGGDPVYDKKVPVVYFDFGFHAELEGCLIEGTEDQALIMANYSICKVENCTLAGGAVGMWAASTQMSAHKTVFLNMTSPVSVYDPQYASIFFNDTCIFWNCAEYPEGARVEDTKLTDWYYPREDSPCRFEKIGAFYIYYGGCGGGKG